MDTQKEKLETKVSGSRRSFLKNFGIAGCTAVTSATLTGIATKEANAEAMEFPTGPWPYTACDPDKAAEVGYNAYFTDACCLGTFKAILSQLAEDPTSPFSQFPMFMMKYGAGGIAGWGTTCGTVNGASAAINLVCSSSDATALINELMAWYTETALPTYIPEGGAEITQSQSNSPLCHASVGNWCAASGYGVSSNERKERCARLVGSVAKKAVELLNAHFAGTFTAEHTTADSVATCGACHGSTAMNNTLGKMDCVSCHTPHEFSAAKIWKKSR